LRLKTSRCGTSKNVLIRQTWAFSADLGLANVMPVDRLSQQETSRMGIARKILMAELSAPIGKKE